jgi:prepilin-type N-terminal cleavage/methylation domain-containing protein
VSPKIGDEGGFTLVEMLVVLVIMGVIAGGITALFTAGINAGTDQDRRYQAQQDGRLAVDKLRREIHGACSISAPATYNTAMSSVTLYFKEPQASPNPSVCMSGGQSVTYCTALVPAVIVGGGVVSVAHYALYRKAGTTCSNADVKVADFLTLANIFDYLPPNSHVTTLGGGTGGAAITTADGSSTLPRMHIDLNINQAPTKDGGYHLVDDIAFRNGPRSCVIPALTC